jgi:O-antigen ligase
MQQVVNQPNKVGRNPTWFWNSSRIGWRINWNISDPSSIILSCLLGVVVGLLFLVSPVLALGLGLAIIIFAISLAKPIILCYLVISAIVLTSGIERGRLVPMLSGNEISLLGAGVIALLIILTEKRRKIAIPKYFWVAFIVLIGGTVIIPIATYLLQGTQLGFSNAFKMVGPIQYFMLFWLFAAIPENESDRRKIIWLMLGMGFIVAFVGLLQGVGIGPVDRVLATLYASSHEAMAARAGRVTSTLGSWNTLGIFMMTIILMCWAVLFEFKQQSSRLIIMGIMAISVLCLIASGSYAGIIGVMIGLLFLQLINPRGKRSMPILIGGIIGIALAIIVFYPYVQPLIEKRLNYQYREGGWVPQTLGYRFKVWREIFIPAIKQHFPWPVYPTVPSYFAWKFEESQYILLLFRTGLVGFISYLTWIGVTIAFLYRRFKESAGFDKSIASAALALIIMLVIAGLTNEVFSFAGAVDYLWIMLGLVASSMEKKS